MSLASVESLRPVVEAYLASVPTYRTKYFGENYFNFVLSLKGPILSDGSVVTGKIGWGTPYGSSHAYMKFFHATTGRSAGVLLLERALSELDQTATGITLEVIPSSFLLPEKELATNGFSQIERPLCWCPVDKLMRGESAPAPGRFVVQQAGCRSENAGLIRDAYRESIDARIYPYLADPESVQQYCLRHWSGRLGAVDRQTSLEIYDSDSCRVVGLLWLVKCGDCLNIAQFAVAPSSRGQGIAELLIRRSAAVASGLGISAFEVSVTKENRPALNLYRRLGFSELGTELVHLR